MNTFTRVEEIRKAAVPGRLKNGAEVLGRLWREGARCASGWSGTCACRDRTEFCQAKLKWAGLLVRYHGGWPYGLTGKEPFAVIEAMRVSWFNASGLTASLEFPDLKKPVKIGTKGTTWGTLRGLMSAGPEEKAEGLKVVEKLQGVFS
jgi:hypothetical protein